MQMSPTPTLLRSANPPLKVSVLYMSRRSQVALPRPFVFWGRLYTVGLLFLLGHVHTHFWLVQPPRWPALLPAFAGQLISLINISLQRLAASQTSPHLRADCSRTFLFPTTLLGPNMFSSLPQTCSFLSDLLFSSCADLWGGFKEKSQPSAGPRDRIASERNLLVCIPVYHLPHNPVCRGCSHTQVQMETHSTWLL